MPLSTGRSESVQLKITVLNISRRFTIELKMSAFKDKFNYASVSQTWLSILRNGKSFLKIPMLCPSPDKL